MSDGQQGQPGDRHVDRRHVGQRLAQVREDAPPEPHAADDRDEAVVEEDEVRGLPRDIRAALPHGDADVGGFERRRVVDAVPGHGDDLAVGLQRLDQGKLLLRHDAGEDPDPPYPLAQGFRIELGHLLAGEHAGAHVDPGLAGDLQGRGRIVARDHRNGDPGPLRLGDGLRDIGPDRIREADQALEP